MTDEQSQCGGHTFPSDDVLDELAELADSIPTFYRVECRECGYTASTWLFQEAETRAKVHSHPLDIHTVAATHAEPPEELGFDNEQES